MKRETEVGHSVMFTADKCFLDYSLVTFHVNSNNHDEVLMKFVKD